MKPEVLVLIVIALGILIILLRREHSDVIPGKGAFYGHYTPSPNADFLIAVYGFATSSGRKHFWAFTLRAPFVSLEGEIKFEETSNSIRALERKLRKIYPELSFLSGRDGLGLRNFPMATRGHRDDDGRWHITSVCLVGELENHSPDLTAGAFLDLAYKVGDISPGVRAFLAFWKGKLKDYRGG